MSTKEQVIAMIQELPNDVGQEDIEYHLYVRRKALRGLQEIREGKAIPHEEVEARLRKWRIE